MIHVRKPTVRRVIQNAAALYAVQFVSFLIPVAMVPYLSRVLGPEGFGVSSFVTAFASALAVLLEFGFNLTATRKVARCRTSSDELAAIAASVMGAKLLLTLPVCALFAICAVVVSAHNNLGGYLSWGLIIVLANGYSPMWFYQGTERMAGAVLLEVFLRVLAAILTLVLVHSPEDLWKYLALTALAGALTTAITLGLVYRQVPWRWPSLSGAVATIRSSSAACLMRAVENMQGSVNTFVLGLVASSTVVGYFSAADRLTGVGWMLMTPISQVLYPLMSRLVVTERERAKNMVKWLVVGVAATGFLGALVAVGLAPWAVPLVMGADYVPAVAAFQVLVWLVPFKAVNSVLRLQWLLPNGMELAVSRTTIGVILANVLAACVLAPVGGHVGMAAAAVVSESLGTFRFWRLSRRVHSQ